MLDYLGILINLLVKGSFSLLGCDVLIIVFFILLLRAILTFLFIFFSEKSSFSTERLSPYECGFEPIRRLRSRFSVRFFLIAILFVVFDVELCLLIPIIFCLT